MLLEKDGSIIEGQFVQGQAHGWTRYISHDKCILQWSENGDQHGFQKKLYRVSGKTMEEKFYFNNEAIPESEASEEALAQRKRLVEHLNYFNKGGLTQ